MDEQLSRQDDDVTFLQSNSRQPVIGTLPANQIYIKQDDVIALIRQCINSQKSKN